MTVAFVLPFLVAAIVLALVAYTVVYRPKPHDINHVILLVRKLDVSELEVLIDAGQEWTLRHTLDPLAFRNAQHDRIRLIREYLRRVTHNVRVVQLWVAREHALIEHKDRKDYNEKDLLISEALQVAVELRMYSLAAGMKVWFWSVFRTELWPRVFVPRLPDLRVQCGVNLLKRYRRLTEVALMLSLQHGAQHERLLNAL